MYYYIHAYIRALLQNMNGTLQTAIITESLQSMCESILSSHRFRQHVIITQSRAYLLDVGFDSIHMMYVEHQN